MVSRLAQEGDQVRVVVFRKVARATEAHRGEIASAQPCILPRVAALVGSQHGVRTKRQRYGRRPTDGDVIPRAAAPGRLEAVVRDAKAHAVQEVRDVAGVGIQKGAKVNVVRTTTGGCVGGRQPQLAWLDAVHVPLCPSPVMLHHAQ